MIRFIAGVLTGWFVGEVLRGHGSPVTLDDLIGESTPGQAAPPVEVMKGPGVIQPSRKPMHPAVKRGFQKLLVNGSRIVARNVRDQVQLWIEGPFGVEAQVGERTAQGDYFAPDIEERLTAVADAINYHLG